MSPRENRVSRNEELFRHVNAKEGGAPGKRAAMSLKVWLTDRRREAFRERRDYGMVPAAIADSLGMSDRVVRRYLHELADL